MPVRARGLGALSLGIALASAVPRAALAQALELEIDWSGECAPAEQLSAQVAHLLRGAGGAYPALEVEIEAERRSATEILLSLELEGDGFAAKRELSVASCDDAHAAAALLIALALDPEAVSPDELKAPDEPEPETEPETEPAQDADAATPAETGPLGFGFELALGVLGDTASLPAATLAPELGLGVVIPSGPGDVSLRLTGRVYLPRAREQLLRSGERATTSIGLAAGELTGCYALREGRIRFGPCAGLELGHLQATPHDLDGARSGGALWAAASGGIVATLWLGPRLAVEGLLAAGIPLQKPEFASHREGEVFGVPQFTARAALRALYRF